MDYQHQNLAVGRWQTLSLAQQLGNVGSEYERALKWKAKNHREYFTKAFDRTLELLDLTLQDSRWHNHRLKELTRLREAVCEDLLDNRLTMAADLKKYFFQFATLARK